ncbi:shufflon system plasmid conjugative transfer pilus tip adhesin PilV [uncultured Chryseobacterium sp.]|uniref:shufflon system plasmid conjugative transfer pilus tip adhesin PilV n=1 Tax=uncultured Chryseobacterium sp. TaxID=259322 RepID=UPI0025EF4490|nr:shufflon system plasmid conjugative transfer pilus tip adhesin PilV [uncultured Chryseobacterium sp.]
MKKNILTVAALMAFAGMQAQIQINNGTNNTITNSNVILDGSTSFSTEAGAGPNVGKGIIIPSVNLVNFEFDLTLADGSTFPTYFDGMIVYNNATGNTLTTGNRPSSSLAVTPGYYYFSNPNGASNGNITGGQWKAMGGTASGGDNLGDHVATKDLAMNTHAIRLKDAGDTNNELVYNSTVDGPRLFGGGGGYLGTSNGTNALTWDSNGDVTSAGTIHTGNGKWLFVEGSNSGIYWPQFSGGWLMNDTSWLRVVNDKGIYTGGKIQSGADIAAGNNITSVGSISAGTTLSSTGDITSSTGNIYAGNNKWFYVPGSNSGIYWPDQSGGWMMNDTSWMRVVNDKGIYTGGDIEIGGNVTSGSSKWFNVRGTGTGIYWPDHSGGWMMNDNNWMKVVNDKGIYTGGKIQSGSDIAAGNNVTSVGSISAGTTLSATGDITSSGGNIYAGNGKWFYVPGSNSGIYWPNYSGGWRMDDTTWMKVVNDKGIYTGGNLQIGGTGYFGGTVTTPRVQGPSDRRFKKDITPIYNATEKLNQLNGYTYTWKDKKEFPGQTLGTGKDMGVIAQEVERVFPDAVMTNKEGYKSVNYNALIPVLIESLKEAHKEIKELKEEMNRKLK